MSFPLHRLPLVAAALAVPASPTANSAPAYSSLPPTASLPALRLARTFANPILPAPSQDPYVVRDGARYLYVESDERGIYVRAAASFVDFASSPRRRVWQPPKRGRMARHLWAPELHEIDGRWYVYFAADDGDNAHHRMWVLRAKTNDPLGDYSLVGELDTQGWAIDGTVFTGRFGERYFLWSGWPGEEDGQQNLYLAPMRDAVTLAQPRTLLTAPTEAWERHALPLCEGPEVLQRDGKTFIIYSASGSWTEHYCLGMLVNETSDFLNPAAWKKVGPIFGKNAAAWGVGHCGFVQSPDGVENWILYHAKTRRRDGWADRNVRAQPFYWDERGWPVFGQPVAPGVALARPRTADFETLLAEQFFAR